MTDLRAAAQQALEALEYHQEQTRPIWKTTEAIKALKAALCSTVEEPVGWLRAIDEALVIHHCGVAYPLDDYETAKNKLINLLLCVQDIATYFAKEQSPEECK